MSIAPYSDLRRAAAGYAARHGAPALSRLLYHVVGVGSIRNVPAEGRADVIAAIAEGTPPRVGN
jgi:hypothetical protein